MVKGCRVGVDLGRYQMDAGQDQPDPRDPRTQHQGPCGAMPQQAHLEAARYSANQHAVWKRCMRCGLRMEYHPAVGATGSRRAAEPTPDLVMRALTLGCQLSPEQWTAKAFDGYLAMAVGERKTGRLIESTTPNLTGPVQGTPPNLGPGGGGPGGSGGHGGKNPEFKEPHEDSDSMSEENGQPRTEPKPLPRQKGGQQRNLTAVAETKPSSLKLPPTGETVEDQQYYRAVRESIQTAQTEAQTRREELDHFLEWEVIEDLPEKKKEFLKGQGVEPEPSLPSSSTDPPVRPTTVLADKLDLVGPREPRGRLVVERGDLC